ncbi:TIGR02444 family protein [Thiotrichales bacterium 19S3-7]|nr:TIGR02444 family protein [Thiotrichales bacterium 19S3-7]MCF6801921.1 TIGR02444 family protein [Thiotrichales bacterium 19S3-11]
MSKLIDEIDNPFWQFSVNLYKDKRVQRVLLNLQQLHSLNINSILFSLWLAAENIKLTSSEFLFIIKKVDMIQTDVTSKIRQIRNTIKHKLSLENKVANYQFYQNILTLELESEAVQQFELYQAVMVKMTSLSIKSSKINPKKYLNLLVNDKFVFDDLLNCIKSSKK